MSLPLINITRNRALWFALFLVLYEFLVYVANDMIMPGMLKVVDTFNGVETDIADSLTMYILGGSSLQLILGPLSDRFGRRPMMILGAGLFLICTVALGASQSMPQFLIGRFFQGMGLCFISVVGYATMQEIFAEMDAVRLMSIMSSISLTAPLLGPLLGAICVYYASWRLIFVIVGSFSVLALWGLYRYMPETVGVVKRCGERIERVSFSLPIIFSNYKKLLANRVFIKGAFAIGLEILPCLVWIALGPILLIKEGGLSYLQYGLWQIPIFGACILGNTYLRHLTRSQNLQQLVMIGGAVMMTGLLMMLMGSMISNHYLWLIPGVMIYFFGTGMSGSPLYRWILFSTHVMKGTASALLSVIGACTQSLGLFLINHWYQESQHVMITSYCCIIGAIYLVLILRCRSQTSDTTEGSEVQC